MVKPSKSFTCSVCFFIVDVDSTWDTSLPEVVGNFPHWFNIHSTNVPGSRFHLLFFNVFLIFKLNYIKSWLWMRGSYFFLHPEFEKLRTNSKPPWFRHDCVEISWCMFRLRSIRALKLGRCPLLGIVISFFLSFWHTLQFYENFIHLKPPYFDVPEVNFEGNVPYEYTEMVKILRYRNSITTFNHPHMMRLQRCREKKTFSSAIFWRPPK